MSIQSQLDWEVIRDSLVFTKETILRYHDEWARNAPDLNRAGIDNKRALIHERINVALKTIETPTDSVFLFDEHPDRGWIFDIIRSSLNIFSLELRQVVDPELPSSELRLKRAQDMVDTPILRKSKTDLYLKEYRGYKQDKKTTKQLLFFSYRNKDRIKVGKISDILESEYNYEIFRAHDTIRKTTQWREEIKTNLNNCDGLIAYVNKGFRYSAWTHQECGWVLALGKPIYSLFLMKKIPGFLEEHQGDPITEDTKPSLIAKKINEVFTKAL